MGLRLGLKIKICDGWDKIFPPFRKEQRGPPLKNADQWSSRHSGQAINEMSGHGQLMD